MQNNPTDQTHDKSEDRTAAYLHFASSHSHHLRAGCHSIVARQYAKTLPERELDVRESVDVRQDQELVHAV